MIWKLDADGLATECLSSADGLSRLDFSFKFHDGLRSFIVYSTSRRGRILGLAGARSDPTLDPHTPRVRSSTGLDQVLNGLGTAVRQATTRQLTKRYTSRC